MVPKKVDRYGTETYAERNLRLKRPLSPHVFIYAMRFHTALSFGHRISGMCLAGIAIIFAYGSLLLPENGVPKIVEYVDNHHVPSTVLFALKFLVALPVTYHYANGFRHMYWDFTARNLNRKDLTRTGFVVLTLWSIYMGIVMYLTTMPRRVDSDACAFPVESEPVEEASNKDKVKPKITTEK